MNIVAIKRRYRQLFETDMTINSADELGTLYVFTKSCDLTSLKDGIKSCQAATKETLDHFNGTDT